MPVTYTTDVSIVNRLLQITRMFLWFFTLPNVHSARRVLQCLRNSQKNTRISSSSRLMQQQQMSMLLSTKSHHSLHSSSSKTRKLSRRRLEAQMHLKRLLACHNNLSASLYYLSSILKCDDIYL
ncbi:hypothetical protein EIN_340280 [Entamoeba invadens IP1]|uniref:Uncharacterized protein n=1 Tax=Entamoeba invadens IP1 TaxID=370355 RepID=A0A0A1UDM8_ENTIV|nr:hypothetical protein EIN_340280 [Entamoeba invadens IP1]ELP94710.1 hypothetical protein EIN_340280 [Entamoeba invadens IP1]|eukprot:XP_004261481.1 hypothetical protein EIN_340280 [Entamoeba invadens IP1]